jgi:glycosyltransferase involved in cell wall biosynthesis
VDTRGIFPVAIFTNSSVMGGLEEHVLQLGRGLHARGFPVGVICSTQEAIRPMRERLTEAGVVVHALGSRRASALGALSRTIALAQVLRGYAGGVLHVHFTGHSGGDLVTLAARMSGIRAVVRSVHVPPLVRGGSRDRLLLRMRDGQLARIICVSAQTQQDHITMLGRDERKCTVVHNGVNLQRFSPDVAPIDVGVEFGLDPTAPIVGTVARLGETRKGVDHFLDAAALVAARHGNARFLIVGDGPLRSDLERHAAELGIASKTIFAGHRNDVPGLLRAMRIFASSSLFEACQYNLLEAMATALPVVSTPVGVAPEVIQDGITGRLVPLADGGSLARAISDLLDEPERATAMGKRGREVIAAQFSVDAMLDGIVGVYREVA